MKGYFRKRGSYWSFTVDIGRKTDGSRNQKTKGGFRTKREAEQACAELITQLTKGDYLEPSKKTVQEAMEAWLNTILQSTLRISTYDNYSKAIVKRIIPALGKLKLKDVHSDHIQSFYLALVKEGLSSEYIRYLHSILKSFFTYQMRLQNITKNVVELAIPPRIGRKEQRTWSINEAVRFLEVAKEDTQSYYIVYLLALYTGLRRGEILSLRWKDCDLNQGKISVCQTLYYSNQQFHFLEPKTSRSNRLVSIPDTVVEILKTYRLKQEKHKREMGSAYEDYDLIAANEIGQPINPRSLTGHFRRMIQKASVPKIRFHDTRHTHATILLKLGEHVKIVSERLGHSNAAMTMNVYSHVTSDMQKEAAKKFEIALRAEGK
ncbi:site-specific integrase [Brevibacillus reuszeri]|uniref:Integrase n=1 Tax=Brevibacillus reuszeri TaxID=54915 RepID=A0A0K9Z189_9BACL|nr:site-specific integrase [Brevibacillus reuszeri]KNB74622.1 integrase [Brevibacillus reuszeri]MED1856565.1 site-specific integrase [Brevibacillus reuszeri]GED67736.1 site-specific integrase [Brevibacillus reuszeri]